MNALGRFALNVQPNACDRCLSPLDPMERKLSGAVITQAGTWCATCEWTDANLPEGSHDLRLERSPEGYAACLRCKRLLTAAQIMERCAA